MSGIHRDIVAIAMTARIAAPDRYAFDDQERQIAPAGAGESADTRQARLLQTLENELYYRCYRRPGEPFASDPAAADVDTMRGFTAALSAANAGSGTWDPGWTVAGVSADGQVNVRRDNVLYRAAAADVSGGADGLPLPAGARARVRVPKEIRQLVQGFYMALGDAAWPDPPDAQGRLARLYWALSAGAAPSYLRLITEALNRLRLPFRTKVVRDPSQYRNADAGVLYIPSGAVAKAWPAIERTYHAVASGLRPVTPMFTHALGPGLGLAEDPGGGISFGQSRCRIAAHALWAAFGASAQTADERACHIAQGFVENGIDPARPHKRRDASLLAPVFGDGAESAARAVATGEPRAWTHR
ncbi:MAG TPA: T3SS effector HopA1 family protein [Pseudolabrys sp.]|nr:T3SS effector HopA1 family protein [Pseudolabrys sp.]